MKLHSAHNGRVWFAGLVLTGVLSTPMAAAAPPSFEADILPILQSNCASCHGGVHKKNGLDLRSKAALLKGGKSGPAIVPGDVDKSLLWKKVTGDEMPKEGEKLSAKEKDTLRAWIAAGAPGLVADEVAVPPTKSSPANDVAAAIDRAIDARLAERKLTPTSPADDATFLRRAFLDLTGRLPPATRVTTFLDDHSLSKRANLIDELLESPEYGKHMAMTWHNLLVPLDNNKRIAMSEFQHWLADGFNSGRGWDKTVAEMLTASGRHVESPATGFIASNGTTKETAVKAAQIFLGIRLECAECHDHPYRPWSQENYWGLVAFFSRTKPANNGGALDRKVANSSVDESVPTSGAKVAAYKALPPKGAMKIPSDSATNVGKVVKPRLLDDTVPDLGDDPPYRSALAAWTTSPRNAHFAKATANRIWSQCFGVGLIDPVDDLDDRHQPVHPEVLALLSREVVGSGFDYRHVLRCICRTRAYQRASTARPDDDDSARVFARMSVKVLGPESLLDCVSLAAGETPFDPPRVANFLPRDATPSTDPKKPKPDIAAIFKVLNAMKPRNDAVNQLLPPGGDAAPTDYRFGIMQQLRLMNGGPFDGTTALADRLAKLSGTPTAIVEQLYLRTLSRRPTPDEARRMADFVKRQKSPAAGYAGVLWVLVNSAEFVTIP